MRQIWDPNLNIEIIFMIKDNNSWVISESNRSLDSVDIMTTYETNIGHIKVMGIE